MIARKAPSGIGWPNVRFASFALAASLIGCASPPPMQEAQPTPTAAAAQLAAAGSSTDSKTYPGYRKVERNGETRFCRVETATGTRVGQKTVCITEQELRQQHLDNQRFMENMSKRTQPCTEGGPSC